MELVTLFKINFEILHLYYNTSKLELPEEHMNTG